MCLRPFGLYVSACLGNLFVSILCMCCSHFSWYCFISFTITSITPHRKRIITPLRTVTFECCLFYLYCTSINESKKYFLTEIILGLTCVHCDYKMCRATKTVSIKSEKKKSARIACNSVSNHFTLPIPRKADLNTSLKLCLCVIKCH